MPANISSRLFSPERKGDGGTQILEMRQSVVDGTITYVRPNREKYVTGIIITSGTNARGKCLLPGFVDSHTICLWGERAEEFLGVSKERAICLSCSGAVALPCSGSYPELSFIYLRSRAEDFEEDDLHGDHHR